jgi:hypothetical protein
MTPHTPSPPLTVPTEFIEADAISFALRRLGRRVGDRQDAPFRDEPQVRDRALLAADRLASKRPTALKRKRRRRRKSVLLRTTTGALA